MRWLGLCCLGLAVALGLPASAVEPAPVKASLAIGVAEFERVPPGSPEIPDVGALLADRLAALGVERVVGPARLQAPPSAEPTDDEVKGLAARSRLSGVVVGRTTKSGTALAIEARLRSGKEGKALATYLADVARPEDLVPAVERLADQIVRQGAPLIAPAAPKGDAAAPGPKGSLTPGSALPIDMGGVKKDAPLDIKSDELEAFQNEKSKRFLFTGNVRVSQDVMSLEADRLEAFYPPDGNEPDRLVATGHVVVSQRDQEARCDVATYLKAEQRIFCRGNAEMRQGDDRVRGKEIEIRLDTDQLIVRGGAEVHIQPKEKPAASGGRQG